MRIVPLVVGVVLVAGAALGQVPDEERQALIDFYHATGGEDWHDNGGWLGDEGTECDWHGVICQPVEGQLRVDRLDLVYNNLVGEPPPSLESLSRLASLRLTGNRLSGEIPADLWGLESLAQAELSNNEFTGRIPDTLLTLEGFALNLRHNRLSGYHVTQGEQESGSEFKQVILSGNRLEAPPPPDWSRNVPVEKLDLSDNRLTGTLDASILPPDLNHLDLSGNALTGFSGLNAADAPTPDYLDLSGNRIDSWPEGLHQWPIRTLYLSDNDLSGPLPDWLSTRPLTDLDLSGNRLSGNLPESFADLELAALDLGDNEFTGPVDPAFDAVSPDSHGSVWLHLGNNAFSGSLPASFEPSVFNSEADFNTNAARIWRFGIRGLDLCWNDLEIPPAAVEPINEVHRGGDVSSCIGRSRIPVEPTLSGSWFLPERSGEGITRMVLENGRVLTYWFTYDENPSANEQKWALSVGDPGQRVRMDIPLGGQFPFGLAQGPWRWDSDRIWQRQTPLKADTSHFSYDFVGNGLCLTGMCSWDFHTGRHDLVRLSQLAGTSCGNQSPFQHLSGAWFNPDRHGEGLIVEVLPDNRTVVYWFTYAPDGSGTQAWMIGQGEIENDGVIVDPPPEFPYVTEIDLFQPRGTGFGQGFDPGEIEYVEWGTVELQFRESGGGRIVWDSELDSYGSGEYAIEPLARPMLAECD